jgi:hypothetical protein
VIVIQKKSKEQLATDKHGRERIAPIQAAFLSHVFARENYGQKHTDAFHAAGKSDSTGVLLNKVFFGKARVRGTIRAWGDPFPSVFIRG